MKKIFIVDNYDSFVYNIVQYIGEIEPDVEVKVLRNDKVSLGDVENFSPTHIVISPGPGRPENAGMSSELVKHFAGKVPILGVCLGHQVIAYVFGGKIDYAKKLMHGKTSKIFHSESGVFEGVDNPFVATRYHSLVVKKDSLPKELVITAESDDGEIMGIQHIEFPVFGVQFHPESILTDEGKKIIANFLKMDNLKVSAVPVERSKESEKRESAVKYAVKKLTSRQNLNYEEAVEVMREILSGKSDDVLISAFLVALRMKGETGDEVGGMAKVMRDHAVKVEKHSEITADTCGTGGDGAGTFNISTTTAFVVASGGVPVAKHGNRSVSSKVGSADVLEAGGYVLNKSPDDMSLELKETGFSFLFAPLLHPAMKEVMPVRRKLGVRTVFNILGPIVNPALVKYQIVGVFDFAYAKLVARALQILGTHRSLVVSGGFTDELTSISDNRAILVDEEGMKEILIKPSAFRFHAGTLDDIKAPDNATSSFELMKKILSGKGSAVQMETVSLNAGAVFWITGKVKSLKEGVEYAMELLSSGKPLKKLEEVVEYQKRFVSGKNA